MKGSETRRWLRGAVIGVVAGLVALGAVHFPPAATYENRAFDFRTRLFADPRQADRGIVAVVLDQASLDTVAAPRSAGGLEQAWPWPRDFHATLVRYLAAAGARAIVFDVVFGERSTYAQMGVTDDDAAFAAAVSRERVVHAIALERDAGPAADRVWAPTLRAAPLTRRLSVVPDERFDKATPPIAPLLAVASGIGWIGMDVDDDGVARALRPAVAYAPAGAHDALEVWAMPVAAASVAGARIEFNGWRLRVNGRRIPLDEDRRMVLRFHGGADTYRQFSYASVLRTAMLAASGEPVTEGPPEQFRDKIVIVGATAAGLLDAHPTPMNAALPTHVLHAVALDNLLHGDPIRRAPLVMRAAVVLALGVVCGMLAMARRTRIALGGFVAVALLYMAAAALAFDAARLWLDVVGPGIAMALAWAGSAVDAYAIDRRERRFLRDALSRYAAPDAR
jgi:adenylate cyclase